MLTTLAELRTNIGSTVRETQISTLIDNFVNLTLSEIWNYHPWTFARQKITFSTVVSQEDYNLDEEVDRIVLIRQRTSPAKLLYVPDRLFYRLNPRPEDDATGTPRFYREWQETGFSTALAAADTVYVNSSSTSDGSSFRVILVGQNSSGEVVSESLTLNGTTNVTSTTTWAADGLKQISKSASTTGTISCYRTTGATLLSEIAPEDSAPRFKRISLYPIPSAVITMYMEYIERLRLLVNDADVPPIDKKWIWVLREGTLAKVWEYKQNEAASVQHQTLFDRALRMMRNQDEQNLDYVPVLEGRVRFTSTVRRTGDSVDGNFPSYILVP